VLWPWTLRDEHVFQYKLELTDSDVDQEKLLERARASRRDAAN
jgi:hypothetical protein